MAFKSFFRAQLGSELKTLGNTFFFASADLVGKTAMLLVFMLFARSFGQTAFGYLSFSYSLASIFVVISDLGINQFIIREIAARNKATTGSLWRLFKFKLILLLPLAIATGVYCRIVGLDYLPFLYVVVMMLYFWIDSLHQFMRNIFRANENAPVDFASRTLERALLVVLSLFFIFNKHPVAAVACFPAAALASMVYDFFRYKPLAPVEPQGPPRQGFFELARKTLPFTVSHILFVIYFRVDTLMLQSMSGFEAVGHYNAAYRIYEGAQLIPIAFAGSLYPAFSRLTRQDGGLLKRLITTYTKIVLLLAAAISIALFLVASPLVGVLYGEGYGESQRILSVLSVGIVFSFYYLVFTYLFAALGKQKHVVWIGAVMLPLNITLNFFLIPLHGALGAAAATVACDALMAITVLAMSRRVLAPART